MPAITYRNTQTNIPRLVNTVHLEQQQGYAYERNGRYFHIFGTADRLWTLSTGLTATELVASEALDAWTRRVFGSAYSAPMFHEPGEVIEGVWRPGLYFKKEIHQALDTNDYRQRTAEQALRILVEKLDEILLYIEPTNIGLQSYGHKSRELLILACTEVENLWVQYMQIAGAVPSGRSFSTNDYVKLLAPLHLADYVVRFKLVSNSTRASPFFGWNSTHPTKSLAWYDAYNKTKHDREKHFAEATLENCLQAISAVIAMFCARHSPFPLIEGSSSLSALFTQHFDIELSTPDPKSFYVPEIEAPGDIRDDLFCGGMTQYVKPWRPKPLVI